MGLLEKAEIERKKKEKSYDKDRASKEYETPLDKIYHLIEEKGEMRLDEIGSSLKLKEEDVARWIEIMTNEGLLTLKYPAIGSPKAALKTKEKVSAKRFSNLSRKQKRILLSSIIIISVIITVIILLKIRG